MASPVPQSPKRSKQLALKRQPTFPKPKQTVWLRIRTWLTLRHILFSLAGLVGAFALTAASVFAYYVRFLPNPHQIQERQVTQSTQLLDRTGLALYSFHGDINRTVVTGSQISPYVKQATISVEDAQFYTHHGFSTRGTLRALLGHVPFIKRFFPSNELAGGGSTITQQYVKNALLTRDQSLSRKLKELILSIEVERTYSKDDILTGYLNQIPYGSSNYGIEAASRAYFSKDAKDLTLSEAATLASIPQAPTYYSPYGDNLADLFGRKNYVLDRMVSTGFISKSQAEQAKLAAPTLINPSFSSSTDIPAPHFVFYVKQKLIEFIGGDPQVAEQLVDQGGYKVTTSLDMNAQALAQKAISDLGPATLARYHASNACLVSVDPKSGEILAMVGSIDFNHSKSGQTNFCAANLQPGSTFKPFIYATSFSPGHTYSPGSSTFDLLTNFGTDATPYAPKDYNGGCEYCGPATNRQALAGSLNIPAVKNFALAGVKESIATAKSLGISTLNRDPSEYGLSLVLGSGEVQPVEMANAYAGFANGGQHFALRPILKIEQSGKVIKDFQADSKPTKALEPEVAYEVSSILSDNGARAKIFGSKSALTLGPDRPVAAKSGTTENNRDAWTVGFTPSIVTVVWVGNNEPNKTMVSGADGSYVAAPIWNRFMHDYLTGKPIEKFNRPSTVTDVTIDRLSNKLPTDQTPNDSKVTDIFAPWQIPKNSDDVHIKVKIDRSSGKLATSLTPADQIDERTYFNVHSEMPSSPDWEGPVQAWAQANGGGVSPPTETDDAHVDANAPTVSITSPSNGNTVTGGFSVTATAGGSRPISKVEFFINDISIGSSTSAPYQTSYDASHLNPGSNTIKAVATNDLELQRTSQITVQAAGASPSSSGASVTGLRADSNNSQATHRPIKLYWTAPTSSALSSVNIYESQTNDPDDRGSFVKNQASTSGAAESASIDTSGLSVGKTYYFSVKAVDSSGNEDSSKQKVGVLILP